MVGYYLVFWLACLKIIIANKQLQLRVVLANNNSHVLTWNIKQGTYITEYGHFTC